MEFYVLNIVNSATTTFSECKPVGKITRQPPPCCEDCGAPLGPLIRVPPLNYQMLGNRIGDLITDSGIIGVSEQFRAAYQECGLQGLEMVHVIALRGAAGRYYLATPAHTYCLVDLEASGAILEAQKDCTRCRTTLRNGMDRLRLVESTWSGDDVFYVANLPGLIVTSKVFHDFVMDRGFTNFDLTHQDEYQE